MYRKAIHRAQTIQMQTKNRKSITTTIVLAK